MRALRVALRADTASFREPHLQYGRQPSLPMPPPATIYGLMAAARGEHFDPTALRFGLHYEVAGQGDDVEYLHIAEVGSRRPAPRHWSGWSETVNLVAQGTPFQRQMHLFPRLALWLQADEAALSAWREAFRTPRYALTLGRSQDLACVVAVDAVDLEVSDAYYLEHSLLPWSFRFRTHLGPSLLMPRSIDPADRSLVGWERYVALEQRVWSPTAAGMSSKVPQGRILLSSAQQGQERLPLDPFRPPLHGAKAAIAWLAFTPGPGALEHLAEGMSGAG